MFLTSLTQVWVFLLFLFLFCFLFQTESRNLELWKQNVFISTANTYLRRIIVPKRVELLFVRCVSQALESKWAVCEPVTQFNLLDGCEYSLLFFLESSKIGLFTFRLPSAAAVMHDGLPPEISLDQCEMALAALSILENQGWTEQKKKKVWLFNENGLCVSERPSLWVLCCNKSVVLCCVVGTCCAFAVDFIWM